VGTAHRAGSCQPALVERRIEGDLRELVISFGETGYFALYRFVVQQDTVRVLAIRHQREIGYLP
jgi:hypothetical protein